MYIVDETVLVEVPKIYGKTKQHLEEETENLRKWMESREEFPEVMNANMLRNFVIINKFNMDKARDHIENYYKMRVKYPEIYVNTNPKLGHMLKHSKMIHWTCSTKLTNDFERIVFYKLRDPKLLSECKAHHCIAHVFNVFEMRLQEDFMYNTILIIDMNKIPLSYWAKFTPGKCYKAVNIMEKVFSFRIKKIYYINMPGYAYYIIAMLKTIMKPKLYERLAVYTDDSILEQVIPKEMLPKDYGGYEESLETLFKIQQKRMTHYQHRFDKLDEIQVDLMKARENENNNNCTIS